MPILPQIDNRLMSSFLTLLDYRILSRGSAYTNYSSQFFPTSSSNNLYTYTCPFKSLVNDTGISGANILSGVYLNNTFVKIGQSGLTAINHYQGAVYFNTPLPTNTIVSGNYSIKDFTVELTDQPEYKLLFETKYTTAAKYNQVLTGLSLDTKTSPIIFLRTKNDENKPFALGGWEDKTKIIRAIVIADTEYQRMAVCNILKDMCFSPFYLNTTLPFDAAGNSTGIPYSYKNLTFDSGYFPWIMDVKVVDLPRSNDYRTIPKNMSMCDFKISNIVMHTFAP